MPPPPLTIDIAICTRDRLPMLKETLTALDAAIGERTDVRVLVVDNGSRDGTGAHLSRLAAKNSRLVVATEPQPGIYHARAMAIGLARADILVFIDDDIVPAPDFLDALATAFADPAVGMVGAAILALHDAPLPDWLSLRLRSELPELPVRNEMEVCTYPVYPPSACLALRRHPCLDYYLCPERRLVELGVGGGTLSGQSPVGGEDTDLCHIYERAGFRIVRLGAVQVHHRVHADRLTPAWMIGKFERDGRLRVRLARLRGKPALCGETVPMLAALPALAVLAVFAALFGRRRAVLVRAYCAKSRGAWRELLWGRRNIRFPYPHPPTPSPVPASGAT